MVSTHRLWSLGRVRSRLTLPRAGPGRQTGAYAAEVALTVGSPDRFRAASGVRRRRAWMSVAPTRARPLGESLEPPGRLFTGCSQAGMDTELQVERDDSQ